MADKRMGDPRILKLPQKGRQILKEETEKAFALLKTLSQDQRKQAVVAGVAYPEIVTHNLRKASMERMDGLRMGDMTKSNARYLWICFRCTSKTTVSHWPSSNWINSKSRTGRTPVCLGG